MKSGFSEPFARYRSEPNAHLPSVPRMAFPTRRSMRMMTSVSMLPRMIGAAIALSFVKAFGMSALHRPHVGNGAGYCRRCRRGRARQMSPRARSLTADKITVGGRDRPLAGRDGLSVRRHTHRTSRLTPFEAGIDKELVEAFGLRITLDSLGARHDPGANARRNLAAPRDRSGSPQIADPAIGA